MTPRCSVVIPTHGRTELVGRCVAALVGQDVGAGELELIVVDSAPSDATRAAVERLAAGTGAGVCYVPVSDTLTPGAARNAGWRRAGAEIVAFTVDGAVPEPHWLSAGLEALRGDVDAVWGPVESSARGGDAARVLPARRRTGRYVEDAEANCFCPRWVLEMVGGFDARRPVGRGEPGGFLSRLLAHGCEVAFAPEAVVAYPSPAAPGPRASQLANPAARALAAFIVARLLSLRSTARRARGEFAERLMSS